RCVNKILFLIFIVLASPPLFGQIFDKIDCNVILKAQFKKAKIKVCSKTLDVEVADSDWLRTIGLMCRKQLNKESGMLFVFEKERTLSFWMKNTYIPLSIAYFTKDKVLKDIFDMEPLKENKSYESSENSLYEIGRAHV